MCSTLSNFLILWYLSWSGFIEQPKFEFKIYLIAYLKCMLVFKKNQLCSCMLKNAGKRFESANKLNSWWCLIKVLQLKVLLSIWHYKNYFSNENSIEYFLAKNKTMEDYVIKIELEWYNSRRTWNITISWSLTHM